MQKQDVHIFLVEDDEIDVEFTRRAFDNLKISNEITVATDGYEALNILRGQGGHPRLPRPYLILLDINMPRMNGLEFLHELRRDAELKNSVVFVLTTSDADADITAAYGEKVAGYFLKQRVAQELLALPDLMDSYARVVVWPLIQ